MKHVCHTHCKIIWINTHQGLKLHWTNSLQSRRNWFILLEVFILLSIIFCSSCLFWKTTSQLDCYCFKSSISLLSLLVSLRNPFYVNIKRKPWKTAYLANEKSDDTSITFQHFRDIPHFSFVVCFRSAIWISTIFRVKTLNGELNISITALPLLKSSYWFCFAACITLCYAPCWKSYVFTKLMGKSP